MRMWVEQLTRIHWTKEFGFEFERQRARVTPNREVSKVSKELRKEYLRPKNENLSELVDRVYYDRDAL